MFSLQNKQLYVFVKFYEYILLTIFVLKIHIPSKMYCNHLYKVIIMLRVNNGYIYLYYALTLQRKAIFF